jgi:hypothetical protein
MGADKEMNKGSRSNLREICEKKNHPIDKLRTPLSTTAIFYAGILK